MATCFANQSPTFQPSMRIIASITNSQQATVTTTFAHDYLTGLIVRLLIPVDHGMLNADKLVGVITVTGTDSFVIDINTTLFDSFSVPVTTSLCAQVIPIGEINKKLDQATKNVL